MRSFYVFFFFFSSRRRHTRFDCDWSSDVCSSDLSGFRPWRPPISNHSRRAPPWLGMRTLLPKREHRTSSHSFEGRTQRFADRSEERRVGKSVGIGSRRIIKKKKDQ